MFREKLFIDIETRKRAINNWKKVRLLIVLLNVCGGKLHEESYRSFSTTKVSTEKPK